MSFLEEFSKSLSNISGISDTPILLTIYSITAIIIISLTTRGIMFLNNNLNNDSKNTYLLNKKIRIAKIIITTIVLFLIWEKQIQSVITFISFIGAAATLALKDIVLNFFAGIYIHFYKPFKLEDRVEVDSIIGDIVNINSLSFEILEVSQKEQGEQSTGIIIRIPNSKIFTDSIKNYTKAFKYIWSELLVKIKLDADLPKNKEILYAIVNSNDIVKRIPKKMKDELNSAIGNYRIYYNNLEPIIYTKINENCVELTIRYLAHPKKARNIESQIWNKIYESSKVGNLDLYTTNDIKKSKKTTK